MNPWMLLGIVLGVGVLAASAAAQANAAIPRVSAWGMNLVPVAGVSGAWDMWVTAITQNGVVSSGPAMLAKIPGGQFIYIPAALVMAQPNGVDWTYTFTPKGATTTYTLVVPGSMITAYKNTPKNEFARQAAVSHAQTGRSIAFTYDMFSQQTPAPNTIIHDVAQIIATANQIIQSFPADGSDASAYVAWGLSSGAQIPSLINNINNAINDPGTSSDNLAQLNQLIPQLTSLATKATKLAASSGTSDSGSTDSGTYSDSGSSDSTAS